MKSASRKIHRPACSGAHPLRIDLISWYSGTVAGIKIKPSIIEPNFPRSMIRSPRWSSEIAWICSRRIRFLTVNQLARLQLSMKSWPRISLLVPGGCQYGRKTNNAPATADEKSERIKDCWVQWKKRSPHQPIINVKPPTTKNIITFFCQERLIGGDVKSYWRTAGSMASRVLTF
jgi:hypothetical protein